MVQTVFVIISLACLGQTRESVNPFRCDDGIAPDTWPQVTSAQVRESLSGTEDLHASLRLLADGTIFRAPSPLPELPEKWRQFFIESPR